MAVNAQCVHQLDLTLGGTPAVGASGLNHFAQLVCIHVTRLSQGVLVPLTRMAPIAPNTVIRGRCRFLFSRMKLGLVCDRDAISLIAAWGEDNSMIIGRIGLGLNLCVLANFVGDFIAGRRHLGGLYPTLALAIY